jgi:hypothetical protein
MLHRLHLRYFLLSLDDDLVVLDVFDFDPDSLLEDPDADLTVEVELFAGEVTIFTEPGLLTEVFLAGEEDTDLSVPLFVLKFTWFRVLVLVLVLL